MTKKAAEQTDLVVAGQAPTGLDLIAPEDLVLPSIRLFQPISEGEGRVGEYVNSVTGEDEQMERVLPLVKKYGAAVVAISNDETGISEDPDVRFEVARKIVNRASDYGIPSSDVVVDPLVMPIGAVGQAGQQVFKLLRRLQTELKVNTTCGASNVSFGLPERNWITGTFLAMAISNGMTSAIMNPMHAEVKTAIMAADVLAGQDKDCSSWIREYRDPNAGTGEGGARRRGGRRRGGAS